MDEYQGLLVSITNGLQFPKRKVSLTIMYSKYSVSFPVVYAGEMTVFNQGYFFRDFRGDGHDESNLPLLFQLYERNNIFKSSLIAELRIESSDFYNHDYYEPTNICLQPIAKYAAFSFQLDIFIKLVKQSCEFSLPTEIDVKTVHPVAFDIVVDGATLDDSIIDKKKYFSYSIFIKKDVYVSSHDIKGSEPIWNQRHILCSEEFADKTCIKFIIYDVVHPLQQSTRQITGNVRVSTKDIIRSSELSLDLSIRGRKQKEIGHLHVLIRPIYPQSRGMVRRDMTYEQSNLNAELTARNTSRTTAVLDWPIVSDPDPAAILPTESSIDALDGWTMDTTLRECIYSDYLAAYLLPSAELGSTVQTVQSTLSEDVTPEMKQLMKESASAPVHTEIKRRNVVEVITTLPRDMTNIYVSDCRAIIRKDVASGFRNQGLRLSPRFKHSYIEKLIFMEQVK